MAEKKRDVIRKLTDSEREVLRPWLQRRTELDHELEHVNQTLSALATMANGERDDTVHLDLDTGELYRMKTIEDRVHELVSDTPTQETNDV